MRVILSMLRGVNVGGHNKIKMDALRSLYASLQLGSPQTYVQSGNVVFRSAERNLAVLSKRIQDAIHGKFGFRPEVILRTTAEWKAVIAKNPFAARRDVEPGKLLVTFLASEPGTAARRSLLDMKIAPEELHVVGRELYIYFPNGQARPNLSWSVVERILQMPFTGRNWNSVNQMLAIAESLGAAQS